MDARRARLACTVRKGDFSLSVDIRGRNQEYGVRKALNLVNEMFVALHEGHPEYLVQQFGISQEYAPAGTFLSSLRPTGTAILL